ncbi:hypothetical protein [Enterococcus alishanensis]|uniref:Accessory Sec system protein Asp3 n=1 Tax=Enterococcus alishanensis TaxID=1303817 RepID=A0ABS6TDV8_9ENTE|nr:hypothetical protein [Enterococcus alishanensis]MBV7391111.1 hypothetical protein [Enterococcus alishanensis]
MHYEIVGTILPDHPVWKKQKERLLETDGKIISVLPSLEFKKNLLKEEVNGINILDEVTKRSHDPESFLFFSKIPTASNAEVFVNGNWTISIICDGDEIGTVSLYPNTRRHVKEVRYTNTDGSLDYIEEYASDGKLFSMIFYHKGEIQEIAYMNDQKIPIVNNYFYDKQMNFVTVTNPQTFEVTEKYNNSLDFTAQQVANIVTEEDVVNFSFMGVELLSLSKTNSHNILHLEESPFDENGNVRGNLLGILEDRINYVQEVRMKKEYYDALKAQNFPINKVEMYEEPYVEEIPDSLATRE